jgi:DNA-binding MarR family transcriptional regulator
MDGADAGRTVSAIARLANRCRREFAARLRDEAWVHEAGMRPPAYGILRIVRERQPVSQRELAETIGIDAGDLVAVIGILEAAGFVRRERDEADRRRQRVWLTPEGAVATARLDAIADEVAATVLAPLAKREREALTRLLAKAAFAGSATA